MVALLAIPWKWKLPSRHRGGSDLGKIPHPVTRITTILVSIPKQPSFTTGILGRSHDQDLCHLWETNRRWMLSAMIKSAGCEEQSHPRRVDKNTTFTRSLEVTNNQHIIEIMVWISNCSKPDFSFVGPFFLWAYNLDKKTYWSLACLFLSTKICFKWLSVYIFSIRKNLLTRYHLMCGSWQNKVPPSSRTPLTVYSLSTELSLVQVRKLEIGIWGSYLESMPKISSCYLTLYI